MGRNFREKFFSRGEPTY